MRCNPDLQNPYDCEEQTQIQAFIRRSSYPSRAANPATINSKARADWRARYEFKCCRFTAGESNAHWLSPAFVTNCDMPCFWWGVFLKDVITRFHMFDESERIRKIIWIIFSAINNINSALRLTQTCCIPPERSAAATHHHLDYFW